MTNVLIIGAGRSSDALIAYCLDKAAELKWRVTVADSNLEQAKRKVGDHPRAIPAWLDVTKYNDRRDLIARADIVLSMLPAHLHLEVAHDCIRLRKRVVTAGSISKDLYRLGDEVRDRELVFTGEMGLDPSVNHMSAIRILNELKGKGATVRSFRSYTGNLVTADSAAGNPWKYKITWSPRNVVLAGQGTAQYLENGKLRCVSYNRVFEHSWPVEVPGLGTMEAYPSRDSLLYREAYGLGKIPTLVRGTIRYPGFGAAWAALVRIGLTDASYPVLTTRKLSYHELMDSFAPDEPAGGSVKERIAHLLGETPNSPVMRKLDWLGLFRKKRIHIKNATPALILQELLERKWRFKPGDQDMALVQHEIEYELAGSLRKRTSTLVLRGDARSTAVAKLIGLPLGIFARLMSQAKLGESGVAIPLMGEVYEPVMRELEDYGVRFTEHDEPVGVAA